MEETINFLILIFLGITWGLSFSLMKIAVQNGGEPFSIAFWQALSCSIVLYAYIQTKHGRLGIKKSHIQLITLLGVFGSALPNVLFYISADKLAAGLLAISVSFIPLLTYSFAFALKMELFSFRRIIGVLIGLIALNLLIIPENSIPQKSDVFWVLIACVAAVSYAIENLLIDLKMPDDIGPVRVACGMNVIGAILVLPFALMSNEKILPQFPPTSLELSILGLGFINAIAYSTFIFLIQRTGPVFASQTGYIVTLGGIIWGMLLFNEAHSIWVWASLLLIILGVILVSPRKQNQLKQDNLINKQ